MQAVVDKQIYNDSVISKCLYWLSEKYICKRAYHGAHTEIIEITTLSNNSPVRDEELEKEFWSSLNDYKLREIVLLETKDIRTILYAKAFGDCEDLNLDNLATQ